MSGATFTAKIAPCYPAHFNEIINRPFSFINEEGSTVNTTVYEAAKSAEAVSAKLQERVITHYKASDGKKYVEDKRQYEKLGELCERIKGVVLFLEQDKGAFRTDETPPTTSRVISTLEDVKRVSEELTGIAAKVKKDYLTGGSFGWYLPDYMAALKDMASKI